MKVIGSVIASLSRKAGGLFESVRSLTFAVVEQSHFDNIVFGLRDDYTDEDRAAWDPLRTRICDTRGPRMFGYAPDLYASLMDSKADLLHNHGIWMYPSVAVRRYARAHSIPYIVSPHGMLDPWAISNSRWKKLLARAVYEGEHLREAACIRALCEEEAQAIRDFGIDTPVCIVPNGIDLPPDEPAPAPRWRDTVPQGRKVLLYLGRIHPKKGLPFLIDAWARVARAKSRTLDEWHLVIAGWDQGGHESELKAQVESSGLARSITFAGPQFGEDKRSTYSAADAFVLPSLGEGMPMVVLEAWAHRLPVLITPQCNFGKSFAIGAALRIQPDAASVAAGLEELFRLSDAERAAIGEKGREWVKSRFVWGTIGAEMGRVYDWILGSGPAPEHVWEGRGL